MWCSTFAKEFVIRGKEQALIPSSRKMEMGETSPFNTEEELLQLLEGQHEGKGETRSKTMRKSSLVSLFEHRAGCRQQQKGLH